VEAVDPTYLHRLPHYNLATKSAFVMGEGIAKGQGDNTDHHLFFMSYRNFAI
jgi:hypothetical protein